MATGFRRRSEELNGLQRRFADEDYQQTKADYRELLKLPAFRRIFAGLMKRGRVFGSLAFEDNETNAVMKNIGWREFAVDVYFTANMADGENTALALKERNDLERQRREECERLTKPDEKKGSRQWMEK